MPPEFTLLQLQRTVEAIQGHSIHKQNFRRLVESTGMVEAVPEKNRLLQADGLLRYSVSVKM